MTILRTSLVGAVLFAVLLTGCSPDDPTNPSLDIAQPTGEAALARYVAVGNSLTAGYMDNGLSILGQLDSFPAQIARQLGQSTEPGADGWFSQPLIALPGFGASAASSEDYVAGVLHWDGQAISVLDETLAGDVRSELLIASRVPTPYNNLGVPGATALDVSTALNIETSESGANPFFDVVLRNPDFGDVSTLGQAIAQGPTLVTLWIGANNALGGATSGEPVLGDNVTPPDDFSALFESIVVTLQTGVAARFGYTPEIVVGNLGSITSAPYFVPKAQFDAVVTGGAGAYPTVEDDVTYVRFPALQEVDQAMTPLGEEFTLTAAEAAVVEEAIAGYNQAIDDLADTHGYTVADVNGLLAGLPAPARTHFQFLLMGDPPLSVEEAAATAVFSLDGLHPNNRGYSLIANVFIEAINTQLGLTGEAAITPVTEAVWDPTYSAYTDRAGRPLAVRR